MVTGSSPVGEKQKRADGLELRVYTQPPGHWLSEELCEEIQHFKTSDIVIIFTIVVFNRLFL